MKTPNNVLITSDQSDVLQHLPGSWWWGDLFQADRPDNFRSHAALRPDAMDAVDRGAQAVRRGGIRVSMFFISRPMTSQAHFTMSTHQNGENGATEKPINRPSLKSAGADSCRLKTCIYSVPGPFRAHGLREPFVFEETTTESILWPSKPFKEDQLKAI